MPAKKRLKYPTIGRKAAALIMVLGIVLTVSVLAGVVLTIMQRQSRITHHQTSRIRAYYAAQAGMNYAYEMLRTGVWSAGGAVRYACINGCVDSVAPTYSFNDPDLSYNVQIAIYPQNADGISQLDIKTKYTYTP